MTARVLFVVQHLLGIGHLRRAAILARGLAEAGFDVLLVSGGPPVPAVELGRARFHQLPPVRAVDNSVKSLVDASGAELDDHFRSDRGRRLVALLCAEAPDIVMTELYPFGRTQMRWAFDPLMEAMHSGGARPLVVASLRDLLGRPSRAARTKEMLGAFERWFDLALIHGDPTLVSFARTFPAWPRLADRAVHTGYVVDRTDWPDRLDEAPDAEVLVSAGGGAVGAPLLAAALAARPLTRLANRRWRLLAGANLPDAELAALRRDAGPGIVIERHRTDFPHLLAGACVSISQAGYNTAIETLCLARRAVLVPFAEGAQTEQAARAAALAERGFVEVADPASLTPQTLAAAVDRAWAAPALSGRAQCDIDGVARTAELLTRHLAAHRARSDA